MLRSCVAGVALVVLISAAFVGCNPEHDLPDTFPASGSVTHEGQPLTSGEIIFESPQDLAAGNPPATGPIINGRYEIQARSGTHTVRIYAPVEKTDASGMTTKEETLPARYNTASELTAEVTEAGPNTKDFALTGKVEKPKNKPTP